MNMLKARLYENELKKRELKDKSIEDSKSDIGWGHQISLYCITKWLKIIEQAMKILILKKF